MKLRRTTPRDVANMLVNAGHLTAEEGEVVASGEITRPFKKPAWWDKIIPKVSPFDADPDDGDD